MPEQTEVSFDLNPDQMIALEPMFALLERYRADAHDYQIWARILPQGIVDADIHAEVKLNGALLVVVPEQSQSVASFKQFDSPDAINFKFTDGTRLSVADEKGDTADASRFNSRKLAA